MKKILVTGGAGFIGSHLCKRLLDEGNMVICLDNFYSGSIDNISNLVYHDNFELINHDIINEIHIDTDIDEIYNLACPASVPNYTNNPIITLNTNFIGSLNVLNLAMKKHAKVLQASTSEIYGDPMVHPQHESYWGNVNPIGIRSCYEEGKRVAETLFIEYNRRFGVDTRIIRIFNTYGPKMSLNDGRVVVNFIKQALEKENLTVYGDGTQTRSFCYIDDLIDGIIKVMNSDKSTGPINLGNPEEYQIVELANLIIKLTDSKSNLTYKTLPENDPKKRKPDISKAQKELGWTPKIGIHEGLLKTIRFYEKLLKER